MDYETLIEVAAATYPRIGLSLHDVGGMTLDRIQVIVGVLGRIAERERDEWDNG